MTLRTQLTHLQAQHDALLQAQSDSPQIDHLQAENTQLQLQLQDQQHRLAQLQAENTQLKAQLPHTQTRLDAIQHLLAGQRNPTHPAPITAAPSSPLPAPLATLPTPAVEATPTQASAPAPSSTAPQSKPPAKRRKRHETDLKIHHIIDALLSWNSAQADNETQLRISIPIIKEFASPLGANYQPVIQLVIKERELEREEHHRRFLIGTRHNASVLQKDRILQKIAHDYLGITNWHQPDKTVEEHNQTLF